MKKLTFIIAAFLLIAVSCNNEKKENKEEDQTENKWSDSQRKAYIDDCVSSLKLAAPEENIIEYCTCLQEKVEILSPNPNDQKKLNKQKLNELSEACLEFIPTANSFEWPEEDKKVFFDECFESAKENLPSEEGATMYCNCFMEKVLQQFENLEAARNMTSEENESLFMDCY